MELALLASGWTKLAWRIGPQCKMTVSALPMLL